ncbi:discoidin domain-containing protein [Streptacidiphilus sp. EB129]|uniref:discoidin domain-containing protein n=1 Tax=Streptacidiphilus sp. EB129 TaxID=3156262 RepID=UPI00351603BB
MSHRHASRTSPTPPTSRPSRPSRRRLAIGALATASVLIATGSVSLAMAGTGGIPGDLACGATTTATSGGNPSAATDCATGTGWQSSTARPQELSVDLGSTQAIDHVTVAWGAGYATSFKVRTSPDGSSWHTQTAVTGGTGGTQTVALPAGVKARHIELYLQQFTGGNGFSVNEFEIFGGSATGTPTPTPTPSGTGTPTPTPTPTPPGTAWTGQFTGFNSSAWKSAWGMASAGTWGFSDFQQIKDSSAPGDGSALQVTYGAGSSANSCGNCPNPGGGQFYTDLNSLGLGRLTTATTLDLKYHLKLPAGYDFGKAGKLPGLYGGQIGQESGGNHGNGWSTRYMWRGNSSAANNGEVYLYTPTNSGPTGYGVDLGLGDWKWAADGNWHTVEQMVNRSTGNVTVWYDGAQVASLSGVASGIGGIPFSGVFFSTFYGGHDTTWGPKTTTHSSFADFSLSTGPQH